MDIFISIDMHARKYMQNYGQGRDNMIKTLLRYAIRPSNGFIQIIMDLSLGVL